MSDGNEDEGEEGEEEVPRNPSASTVICPVGQSEDKVWIDAVGTPKTSFTLMIWGNANLIKLDQPYQVS